jgi:membrane dipeptidase
MRFPVDFRLVLQGVFLLGGATLLFPQALSAADPLVPVIDLHVDLSYQARFQDKEFRSGLGQYVAEKLIPAGVRGVVLPLYVPLDAEPHGRSRYQLERSYAHVFQAITQTAPYSLPGCGIHRGGGEKRLLTTWLAFEGSGPIGGDEAEVRKWVLRGVRSFGLVHAVHNELATSSGPIKAESGLTDEGKKFIRAVANAGALVDVSHASDKSTDDAIALSLSLGRPLIATHSNARALAPHPRNLTDEQIRGIAKTGGVIGVNFHRPFLAKSRGAAVSLKDVVEQVRYLKAVGGIDVVALGSDFEGGISAVPELSDATQFQRLAAALRKANFSEAEVHQVFHQNAWRVLCKSSP